MQFSVQLEGSVGLNWESWQKITTAIEQMGYDGITCCDHFATSPPVRSSLEVFTALTELAVRVPRIHIGTLVAPFSFRDPVMMARQSAAIDLLSGGRMILGVGAGWNEYEHKMFGYPLGNLQERMDRFEEGLIVISQLMRGKAPVTFNGKYYQLHEAELSPRPAHPTRLLVGGGGPKRTLPLVARYADFWNFLGPLETFKERSALLDDLLEKEGRNPGDVKRTVMVPVFCWRSQAEMERLFEYPKSRTPEENLKTIQENMRGITGEPDAVIERLQAYAAAGVDEIMVQWFSMEKFDGLQTIAEEVLPVFQH